MSTFARRLEGLIVQPPFDQVRQVQAGSAGRGWWVSAGYVDLFLVRRDEQGVFSRRLLLGRVEQGHALMDLRELEIEGTVFTPVFVPGPDARYGAFKLAELLEQLAREAPEELADLARALMDFAAVVADQVSPAAGVSELLEMHPAEDGRGGSRVELPDGGSYAATAGGDWIEMPVGASFDGRHDLEAGRLLLPERHRVLLAQSARLRVFDVPPRDWSSADWMRALSQTLSALGRIAARQLLAQDEDLVRRAERQREGNARWLSGAARELGTSSGLQQGAARLVPGEDWPRWVSDGLRLQGHSAMRWQQRLKAADRGEAFRLGVIDALRDTGINFREVALREGWSQFDAGTLLLFLGEERKPLIAVPRPTGGYTVWRPDSGEAHRLSDFDEKDLHPFALSMVQPFPERPLVLKDLLRLALRGLDRDLWLVALLALCAAGVGLLTPILSGRLVDSVIPRDDRQDLLVICGVLLAAAVAVLLFELGQHQLMLRIEGRMSAGVEMAVWDRVLRLPTEFFGQYSAGDLANRINAINVIRSKLTSTTMVGLFGGLTSLLSVLLLFYYSVKLAWIGLILAALAVLVVLGMGYMRTRLERRATLANGRLQSLTLQLLMGISKLRFTANEMMAFGLWTHDFVRYRKLALAGERISGMQQTFFAVFPVVSNAVILFFVLKLLEDPAAAAFSTGDFISFTGAYASFVASLTSSAGHLLTLAEVTPLYERVKPILEQATENVSGGKPVTQVSGNIQVSNLRFGYPGTLEPVLKDLSLTIRAGEFVALVGPSGSGKSTLLRLLLGFDKPQAGSISFDENNLKDVEMRSLRRHFGVVLQNGKLFPGDLFSNISCSERITLEEAWEAARLCGLEQDIKNMPMGMNTVVSDGIPTLSGGQRQRVLIARALARKPRILFFDEATSALDNITQAMITENLRKMRVTRVVVAHRLSTVRDADRIVVLDGGRIVEQGSYEQLMARDGLFAQLAKRQMAEEAQS